MEKSNLYFLGSAPWKEEDESQHHNKPCRDSFLVHFLCSGGRVEMRDDYISQLVFISRNSENGSVVIFFF